MVSTIYVVNCSITSADGNHESWTDMAFETIEGGKGLISDFVERVLVNGFDELGYYDDFICTRYRKNVDGTKDVLFVSVEAIDFHSAN